MATAAEKPGSDRISTKQMREKLREECAGKEDVLRGIDQMEPDDVCICYAILFPTPFDPTTSRPPPVVQIAEKVISLIKCTPHQSLQKIVGRVRPYIAEYRKAAGFDTNAECFAALEVHVRREAVRTRMQSLLREKKYRRLCKERDNGVGVLRKYAKAVPAANVGPALALLQACYDDLAGVLFALPRLIPIEELQKPSPETKQDMMWGEPIPILIDDMSIDSGSSQAVRYHLMPGLPSDSVGTSTPSHFLWGRRALVSIPLTEWLQGKSGGRAVSPERLGLMLRLLLRTHMSEVEVFSYIPRETMAGSAKRSSKAPGSGSMVNSGLSTEGIMERRAKTLRVLIENKQVPPAVLVVLRALQRQYANLTFPDQG